MQDDAGLEVEYQGDVVAAFAEGELVNGQIAHPAQAAPLELAFQIPGHHRLDQIPADAEKNSHMEQRHEPSQRNQVVGQAAGVAGLGGGKRNGFMLVGAAVPAEQAVTMEHKEIGSQPGRDLPEGPLE